MNALILALLLIQQSPRYALLFDDAVNVAPGKLRTLDISLPVEPARVICTFEVIEGESGVRAVLLRKDQMERWQRGESHGTLAGTPYETHGAFSHRVKDPGQYVLVLDNRMEARRAAKVQLMVRLVYAHESGGPVRHADPVRAQILVWASVLIFGVVAVWAGNKARKAF